jgi:hypothetical protein
MGARKGDKPTLHVCYYYTNPLSCLVQVTAWVYKRSVGAKVTRRATIFGFGSVLLLAAVLWFRFSGRSEASYHGKSVDYWFKQYLRANHNPEDWTRREDNWKACDESKEALVAMGTNAIPYLLEKVFISDRDSALKQRLAAWIDKLPEPCRWPKPLSQDVISFDAMNLVCACRPPLSQIRGYLESHLIGTNAEFHVKALQILACCNGTQEDKIPYVIHDITNADLSICMAAFELLSLRIQTAQVQVSDDSAQSELKSAKTILPALLDSFQTSHRWFAMWAIGALGPRAVEAVPFLQKAFFATTNWDERLMVAEALTRVDPEFTKTKVKDILRGFETASLDSKFKFARVVLTIETNQPLILHFLNTEWANETNDLLRLNTWRVLTDVLHTNLPSPNVPLSVLRYQSPSFERWLGLGEGVRTRIEGPTLEQWLSQANSEEPQYQGLGLKKWLNGDRPGKPSDTPVPLTAEGEKIIRAIGTNAIPWLLIWTKSANAEDYIPGRRGFAILREDAHGVTPALIELTRSKDIALQLGWSNTWPALVCVLHDQDQSLRSEAADYLYKTFPQEAEQVGLKEFVSPWLTQEAIPARP